MNDVSSVQNLAARRAEMEAITEKEMTAKILDIAWPATVEAVLQMMIGIISSSLIGNYSTIAVGAVGFGQRITRLAWGIFAAIGTGSTVMVARSIGAGDQERANSYAEQAIVLTAILISIVTAILFLFPAQLVEVLYNRNGELNPELVEAAVGYIRLTSWGVPLMSVMQVSGALMRGAGNTKVPMIAASVVNVCNAIFSFLLIFGNMGFPELGLDGAGIASNVAQLIGAIISIYILMKVQTNLQISFKGFRLMWSRIREVLDIGIPAAGENLLMQFGQIALAGLIGSMGVVELAAHTQGVTAESISYMPSMGFSIAATSLVGMSVGVGSVKLSERYVKVLAKWNMILTACTASLLIFFPKQVFGLLSNEEAVVNIGVYYLIMMGFCQFPQQLTGVLNGCLRGGGDTKATMFNSMVGLWFVRVPLSYLFVHMGWFGGGIISVWIAMSIDLFVRFFLAFFRYRKGLWKRTAMRIAGELDEPQPAHAS